MAERWLLIETFGGDGDVEPTVIGIGGTRTRPRCLRLDRPTRRRGSARDPAGFNLTTGKIGGSDDLLDLYGVASEDRRTEENAVQVAGLDTHSYPAPSAIQ